MDFFYFILGFYILPMILNILFTYSDKQEKTINDLMSDNWWTYFIPIINISFCIMIPIYYLIILIKIETK